MLRLKTRPDSETGADEIMPRHEPLAAANGHGPPPVEIQQ